MALALWGTVLHGHPGILVFQVLFRACLMTVCQEETLVRTIPLCSPMTWYSYPVVHKKIFTASELYSRCPGTCRNLQVNPVWIWEMDNLSCSVWSVPQVFEPVRKEIKFIGFSETGHPMGKWRYWKITHINHMYWRADNEQFLPKQQAEAFCLHIIYKQTFSNFALKQKWECTLPSWEKWQCNSEPSLPLPYDYCILE